MNGYYIFSDECGCYQQHRNGRFIETHPFYIRSSILLELSDYKYLEEIAQAKREELQIGAFVEIKWAEIGCRYKGKIGKGTESISDETVFTYISFILESMVNLRSCKVFFSVFDNSTDNHAREETMIKMHIQNAFQRAQLDISPDGFAVMIIDDISPEQIRKLKEISHEMLVSGDFVEYTNIKKSLLTDFSHHCAGLQLADYCAGVLKSCLMRIMLENDRIYRFAHEMMFSHIYKKIRHNFEHPPYHSCYGYGIKEVPNNCGKSICKAFAKAINDKLDNELLRELHDFDD